MLGLSSSEAKTRIEKFGYNELIQVKKFTALKILVGQFSSFLVLILLLAGAVSILLGEIVDGIAILSIIIVNAIIGFMQEYKAENAVEKLKEMTIPTTIVIRDNIEKIIDIRELVPDDVVILNEGDKIPADLEIIEAFSLKVDESMLTGESVAVNKYKDDSKKDDKNTNQDNNKTSRLFSGTIITSGRAKAKVISTGENTEFGKIVKLLNKNSKTKSPLTKQLDQLGKKIGIVTLVLVAVLFVLGALRGISWFEMLMTSVALGVSAIPEGMPIIVTLTLAIGIQILAKKNAIVRKMNSVETLGATTIICSDKTGTLTLNEMTVKKINTSFTEKDIAGAGYEISEKIKLESKSEKKLLEICENCNNSFVDKEIIGDPTEVALKILTRKAGYHPKYKSLDEMVFTSDRKMMSTYNEVGKQKFTYTKGAFEEVIKHCSFILKNGKVEKITANDKKEIIKIATKYSEQALRVLGFAYREGEFSEKDLIFVGLVGMIDPPRKTVKKSLEIALQAGIKVKIITGDNAITAKAIAEKIGLVTEKVMTGDEIDKMNDKDLIKAIHKTQIFARTKPEHKYRIVDLLQKDKEVVAVTGDGVNDAPALKHADVGIAMGIKGTEATKDVADIVLKDDNFSTIVETIKEGRRIYHNILAFIKYMLSANFDTIMAVGILTLFGFPLPILPLQILWINIATDAFPALALGRSPANKDLMLEKPHPKQENIFRKFFRFITVAVILQTVANLLVFFVGRSIDISNGVDITNLDIPSHARTIVFTQIVVFEIFFVFVCKEEKSVTLKSFLSNKLLIAAVGFSFLLQIIMIYSEKMQSIFKTVPLSLNEWLVILACALTAFLVPKLSQIGIKKKD